MIDLWKIKSLALKDQIRKKFDFGFGISEVTGEVLKEKRSVNLKGMVFTYDRRYDSIRLKGSPHIYDNGGGKNNDRFTYKRFLKVAEELSEYIAPQDQINVLEFGLNIITPFAPSDFLQCLIAYKKKRFNREVHQRKDYCWVGYSQYKVKIYNKGLQQGGENILRLEIHVNRMQWLSGPFPCGITWGDLQKPTTWEILGGYLLKIFDEIIYYDPTVEQADLPPKDRALIDEGNNPLFWEKLNGLHQERVRDKYQTLIRKHGTKFTILPRLIKEELGHVLPEKLAESYQKQATGACMPMDELKHEMEESYQKFSYDDCPLGSVENRKLDGSYPSLDSKKCTQPSRDRNCTVTGLDISMQKPTSRFLNKKGLIYLYEKDRKAYNQLLFQIPPKWHKESLDIQIYKIAHHIRDQYTNSKGYNKRAINSLCSQPALFNNWDLISDEKKAIANRP